MKEALLIKSNRYGITIHFDPERPYEELLTETVARFESCTRFFDGAQMAVEFTGRTFTEEEACHMAEAIQTAAKIQILCIVEKNTYTETIHKRMLDESLEAIHERDGQFYKGTLKGRQILESETSIVIVGDIDEGATVISRGNVTVTGNIYGSVIAGAYGNKDAFIAAGYMNPKKLRIGDSEVKPIIGGSYSWAKLS